MTNQAYSLKFAQIGKDVIIWPMARIIEPEKICIGDSVIIDDFSLIIPGSKTQIGSFVHIASFSSIVGGGDFLMEDFSGISGGARIYTGNDDYLGGCMTNPTVPYPYRIRECSFVHIKKHSIIGANSVVLPGVVIGEGAIVGANSLVKKDCEPWTIYGGSPAKPIKTRFREKILELEKKLYNEFYDNKVYIPKNKR